MTMHAFPRSRYESGPCSVSRRLGRLAYGLAILLGCLVLNWTMPIAHGAEPSAADLEFFEKKIRPVLVQHCQECHGAKQQKGELRLDSLAGALKGGDTGPAVVPGELQKSLLVDAVSYTGLFKMPPKGKLPAEAIADLTEWVKRGAPWPKDASGTGTNPAGEKNVFNFEARKATHWFVKRPVSQPLPEVTRRDWPRDRIDHFLLAKLEAAGLAPATEAERHTWLRRVTFDLIGLPPTLEEISQFLVDRSPDAHAKVVDRLLASPQYGERWGRHWLDLVRFAETRGHEFDFEVPHAHEYRDYVIRAFNADVPYRDFVMEHVAGDLLPQPRRHPTERFNESIIGTGFFFLGEGKHSPVDIRVDEAERVDNQLDVFAKALLGLTVSCARCHDHKFDAISQKDYYALAGFLQSSRFQITCVDDPEPQAKVLAELKAKQAQRRTEWREALRADGGKAAAEIEAGPMRVARSLVACVELADAKLDDEKRVAEVAGRHNLAVADLKLWRQHLHDHALKTIDDPFHPWAIYLQRLARRKPGEASGQARSDVAKSLATLLPPHASWNRLQQEWRDWEATQRTDKSAPGVLQKGLFEDFSQPRFTSWRVSGDAFGDGPVAPEELPFEAPAVALPVGLLGQRIVHSGTVSPKLQGALRSPTFKLSQKFLAVHAAGVDAKINLIIDGFQLIRNPIYGGLTLSLKSPDAMQWHFINVEKWVGHDAYVEVLDEGNGFAVLDMVVSTDQNSAPSAGHLVQKWLTGEAWQDPATSLETLARTTAAKLWLVEQTTRRDLATGESAVAENAPAPLVRAQLLAWSRKFALPGTLGAASQRVLAGTDAGSVAERLRSLDAEIARLEAQIGYRRKAMALVDGTAENERVFIRGNPNNMGETAPRSLLKLLAGAVSTTGVEQAEPGSGRLQLARQLVDAANPLVPRVIVNRIWKHHFGEGLVRSVDDFGNMGQAPSHPELLDDLTTDFVRDGWSLKRLHRRLVLSSAYRMASGTSSEPSQAARAQQVDPDNRLWHRMPVRRLEAEAIRDAMLAVSGRLDLKMYGPSVMPHLTEFMDGRGRPGRSGALDGDGRRSVYINVRRNFLTPFFLAFDYPIPFSTMGKRSVSNVPAQSLAMLNNPFVLQQAELWAKRELAVTAPDADRIRTMYLRAYGRPPSPLEQATALEFLLSAPNDPAAWTSLAHVLLNVKEFLFVE